ncbi:hypothetical protein BSNK01_18820 [Bacillaceae bacterium]
MDTKKTFRELLRWQRERRAKEKEKDLSFAVPREPHPDLAKLRINGWPHR